MALMIDGVLLIDKPSGMTSFDVVRTCKKIFHEKKIGHTGTLDPNATGLMVVLLGKYTKLLQFCVKDEKQYHAHFSFGEKRDTEDIWGALLEEKPYQSHTEEELQRVAQSFLGASKQMPPMYSAIKKDGKKLYEYARNNQSIEVDARDIYVNAMEVKQVGENDYIMDATVSSGTYIRSLIRDFGEALGEYATMTSLRRNAIEHLKVEDANALDALEDNVQWLDPKEAITKEFSFVYTDEIKKVQNGMTLKVNADSDKIIFMNRDDVLLAAYEKREDGYYHCLRGLL